MKFCCRGATVGRERPPRVSIVRRKDYKDFLIKGGNARHSTPHLIRTQLLTQTKQNCFKKSDPPSNQVCNFRKVFQGGQGPLIVRQNDILTLSSARKQ